jgi:hypothetical protein
MTVSSIDPAPLNATVAVATDGHCHKRCYSTTVWASPPQRAGEGDTDISADRSPRASVRRGALMQLVQLWQARRERTDTQSGSTGRRGDSPGTVRFKTGSGPVGVGSRRLLTLLWTFLPHCHGAPCLVTPSARARSTAMTELKERRPQSKNE